ncbi:MAG: hypothetical protein COA73_04025 [Candidatus Hydrogenedentota bacterium]|nr:MAG: hypothetical protein COA73_04025 [Candidatus Hydrogenedentota bacterium]
MSKHDAHIKPHPGDTRSTELGYEVSDVNVKGIILSGVAMVISCVIAFVFSIFVAKSMKDGDWGARLSDVDVSPLLEGQEVIHNEWVSGVRLEAKPGVLVGELNAEAHAELNTMGTQSESPLIYRIPVDQAIDLVVEHGLPNFEIE